MIARIVAFFFAGVLHLLARTWRKTFIDPAPVEAVLARERVLVGFWHGQTAPLYVLFRDRGALIFTSRSFRGDVIRAICATFGFDSVPLPDHAGDEALALMREASEGRRLIGIALDGPMGPYHAVKRGTIQLASECGLLFLPLGVHASRSFVTRRWDRMEIPLPFARVTVAAGPMLAIPPNADVAQWTTRITEAMEIANRASI